MGTVIQMQATSTGGTESGLAQIDIPLDGEIVGVEWTHRVSFDTTLDFQTWQLSFGSTSTVLNDSRQVISNHGVGDFILSTAAAMVIAQGGTWFVKIPDVRVGMGERIFLHSVAAAGVVGIVRCNVHFSFDLDLPKARRR